MAYYNRELKRFDQSNFEYLTKGNCATVDYDHNIIFKHYFSHTLQDYRLKACVFDILKDINNPHFIELIDIYREETLLKSIIYTIIKENFTVDAYSAKYYENDNINVLKQPIDYFLDNIRELEILFGIFSDNSILTDDLHSKNIIYNSQKMIIVDPDCFRLYQDKDIIIRNKQEILRLCESICDTMLRLESKYTGKEIDNMVNKLTGFEVNEKTEVAYELSKKLVGVKRPIDYLVK